MEILIHATATIGTIDIVKRFGTFGVNRKVAGSNQIKFYWSHTYLADVIAGVARSLCS
jgi:hypothetical protein